MRELDPSTGQSLNTFRRGTTFDLVVDLYKFDERLRSAVFTDLIQIELARRAQIGHILGRVDPLIHLDENKLGPVARQPDRNNKGKTVFQVWSGKYQTAIKQSREDFVDHHIKNCGGQLPNWVAVEVMGWGTLSHLFRISPKRARDEIASQFKLSAAQFDSWLKCLNILRNLSAHHARLFNRGFDITPKLSDDTCLDAIRNENNRVFAQLTLIRFLQEQLGFRNNSLLPDLLESYPHNDLVPFSRLGIPFEVAGAPFDWRTHPLWR